MQKSGSADGAFPPTMWSVVLAARGGTDREAQEALERLFRIYWKPLNGYIRSWCPDTHRAEDLTQGFCFHLLKKDFLRNVNPDNGKFRSFLLAALKNYMRDEWAHSKREKRGGKTEFVSLDAADEDGKPLLEIAEPPCADRDFDRAWAEALLTQVSNRLRESFRQSGKLEQFEALQPCLLGQNTISYAEIGEKLGKTENAVKQEVRRLRLEFQRIFREEIRQTITASNQFDDEVRHLMSVLGS